MLKFEKGFKNPDRRYAIFPIIHGQTEEPVDIEKHDRLGFAGIVGNIKYSRNFPTDEKSWKDTEKGFRSYINKGMHTWIYDEKGYPSGTAGGYVTEKYPEYIAKGLYCFDYWRVITGPCQYRSDIPGDKLYKSVLVPIDGGEIIDVTDSLNENNVLYLDVPEGKFWLFSMSIRRLFDGTHCTQSYSEPRNYISLSDKKATEAFINCTHENYKKYLSDEFGKGILAMFTDEPSLVSWNGRTAVFPILPWLDTYPEDFEKKYGYEFYKACVSVVLNKGPEIVKRRCDFWEFIADSVADGYFGTIQKWCHENNLKSSGHMLREEVLQFHIPNYGSFMRSLKKFDWPGFDMLHTETGWLMRSDIIPQGRLVASVADINGEKESFTEFSDHYVRARNAVAPISMYYDSVNWHHAMGVNNFTSYYSWKQISDEDIVALNKYTARLGYLLRQGKRDSRIGVFYPEAAMWAAYTANIREGAVDDSPVVDELDRAFAETSWAVLHRQAEFDYIDSEIILKGKIKGEKLTYKDREYYVIALPCTRVLENSVMDKLIEFADNGGIVVFTVSQPEKCRETGESSEQVRKTAEYISKGKMHAVSVEGFGKLIDFNIDSKYKTIAIEKYQPNILSHVRIAETGERIIYLANMTGEEYNTALTVNGNYSEVYEANPESGEIKKKNAAFTNDRVVIDVTAHRNRCLLLIVK
ncbi:MAG: glycosyl hydrolase [Candidatus Borkfalkiaceae bacterium]|nr:glycosyl hydrolase [Christensenellaceae bacterium]